MARKKYLPHPRSADPTDWLMYCDMLQDAGAPQAKWGEAKRVAESLVSDPTLWLFVPDCRFSPWIAHIVSPCHTEWKSAVLYNFYPMWVRDKHLNRLRYHEVKSLNQPGVTAGVIREKCERLTPQVVIEPQTPFQAQVRVYMEMVWGKYGSRWQPRLLERFLGTHMRSRVPHWARNNREWYN